MARTIEGNDGDIVAFGVRARPIVAYQIARALQKASHDNRLREAERKPSERRTLPIAFGMICGCTVQQSCNRGNRAERPLLRLRAREVRRTVDIHCRPHGERILRRDGARSRKLWPRSNPQAKLAAA